MENLPENRDSGTQDISSHQFEVRGYAPFVRLSRGGIVNFKSSDKVVLSASGGLLGTPTSPSTVEGGIFRISTLETCQFKADYDSPIYLLKYDRLREVLRNRYDVEIQLRPHWRENLWPYLFDFYTRYGRWPMWKSDYTQLFRQILLKARISQIEALQDGAWFERLRSRIMFTMLARLGAGWSARKLGAEAERISRAFFKSEHYKELLAEAEMFISIPTPDSVIPLAGDYVEDEIWFRTPFETAHARKVSITGAMKVEYKREYGELFDREFLCSFLELYTTSPIVFPRCATILALQARVPLDAGEKKVYGMTVPAPFTCKAENVRMELLNPPKGFLTLKRPKESSPEADPTNLYIKVFGTEA